MVLKAYLKFLLKSQNQHGLHSPFVYALVTECFYDKSLYPTYKTLKSYRKALLNNDKIISVTDFGAGSRVFKSERRKVSAIAKHMGLPLKRAKFLFRLSVYLKCENVLELGTSLGMGTSALALSQHNKKVTTVEGCAHTSAVAGEYFKEFGLENICREIGEFSEIIDQIWKRDAPEYDLIYFDGHHTQKAILEYFEKLLPTAHNDSIFVFDDIHWSRDMEEAWEIIKRNPEVRVTVDTFNLGLVFFRREQAKQHFSIRL